MRGLICSVLMLFLLACGSVPAGRAAHMRRGPCADAPNLPPLIMEPCALVPTKTTSPVPNVAATLAAAPYPLRNCSNVTFTPSGGSGPPWIIEIDRTGGFLPNGTRVYDNCTLQMLLPYPGPASCAFVAAPNMTSISAFSWDSSNHAGSGTWMDVIAALPGACEALKSPASTPPTSNTSESSSRTGQSAMTTGSASMTGSVGSTNLLSASSSSNGLTKGQKWTIGGTFIGIGVTLIIGILGTIYARKSVLVAIRTLHLAVRRDRREETEMEHRRAILT